MPSIDPKAPGCILTPEDSSRVITSCAIFMCFFSFGSCLAALGSALPQIAHDLDVEETSLGYVFIARGGGYLSGTLGSACLIEIACLKKSKMLLASIGILVSGISLALVPRTQSLVGMYVLIVFQGAGFGSIDSLCNIVLPEIWDVRVQPWMQAAHACFGIGGIVGPILVGYYKFKRAFTFLGFLSGAALLTTLVQMLLSGSQSNRPLKAYMNVNKDQNNSIERNGKNSEDNISDVEMTCKEVSLHQESEVEETNFQASGDNAVLFPPMRLKLVLGLFFFVYVGIEIGYGGWIASYVIIADLTDSHAKAAYINSVFFMTLSLGRVLAIFLAIWVSNTSMLRFQLMFSLFSAIFIIMLGHTDYFNACLGAGFFGFACSSMFPLVMTVVGDYGYTMNSSATLIFILGSTFGEAIVPVCMGFVMKFIAPGSMNACVLASVLSLLVIYFAADWMMKSHTVEDSKAVATSEVTNNVLTPDLPE